MTHDVMGLEVTEQIRSVVERFGNLSAGTAALDDDEDLFRAGMSSHSSVAVMLALEGLFCVEFPDAMLRLSTFETISAMRRAVLQLIEEASTP